MKWFNTDKNGIKEKEELNKEQIEYLLKPSLAVFGPFNVLIRKHWDIVLGFFITNVWDKTLSEDAFFSAIMLLVFYVWIIYFSIKNSRRLAWNRNNWEDFNSFKRSEEAWQPWGILFFIIVIIINIASFFNS